MSNADRRDRAAIVVAGHTGDEDRARAGLDSPDAGVRALALGAMARGAALTVADLRRAAGDRDPAVRRRAAEEAGRLHGADPRPVVADLLHDEDDSVVEMAAWALGEHPPRDADVASLARVATDHRAALCREAAVAALGALGDDRGVPAILTALSDRAAVRRRAVIALAPFDGEPVDRALRDALADRDWQVRQAAEDLIDPDPHA